MGHTYSRLLVHAIFSTKGRRPLIGDCFRERLYRYMGGIARSEFGRALKIGGTDNHVHALLSIRAVVSVAEAIRKFKGLASLWLHDNVTEAADFAWQGGYGAFSVSESNVGMVDQYIARQSEHHKIKTFEEEFVEFLNRHGIEYDPKYVWD